MLLDGKEKKPCFINHGDTCATPVSPSPNLACSDDESEGCATPSSCSSSVYSQDEFDLEQQLGYPTKTKIHDSEPHLIDCADRSTPAQSHSSSVHSQDEHETERVETDTKGWYELDCIDDYFDDCQRSKSNGLEENVEQDYSLAIDIHYK